MILQRNVNEYYSSVMSIIGGTNSYSGIYFGDKDDEDAGRILYYNSNDSMRFYTGAGGPRLYLSSTGRLGIGTDTPQQRLDVDGKLHLPEEGNAQASPTLQFGDGNTGFYENTDDLLYISIGGTGWWYFRSSQLRSASSQGPAITSTTSTTTVPVFQPKRLYSDLGMGSGGEGQLDLITEGINALHIDINQNVGIGTITPQNTLNVIGDGNFTGNLYSEGNLTLGQKITFAFGEIIDNIVDGWVRITGNLNVIGDLNITGNITGNQIYGEMYEHNHTGTTLTFSDGVWNRLYFSNNGLLNGFTYTGGFMTVSNLTAQVSGVYKANYRLSGSGQNNHIYHSTIMINSIAQDKCGDHKKMSAGGDIVPMGHSCLIELNAGDDVQIAVMDYGASGDGDYYSGNLNLVRIGN